MPNRFMLYHMREKTPDHFQFVIKAYRGMTHKRDDNEQHFHDFKEALKPLIEVDKLGCVLAQFPTSFRNRDENRDYLKEFKELMGDIPIVVEFRHEEWIDERIFDLLEEEQLGYVCVDEPQFKTLVPPIIRATGPIGYIRFHGRNYKNGGITKRRMNGTTICTTRTSLRIGFRIFASLPSGRKRHSLA